MKAKSSYLRGALFGFVIMARWHVILHMEKTQFA